MTCSIAPLAKASTRVVGMMSIRKDTTPCSLAASVKPARAWAVQVRGVDVHARAGLEDVDHHQPDHQGDGRQHLEIDQGLDADPAHLLEVAHLGHADHHGAEDDRRQQHLDQLDEAVGQGFQRLPDVREPQTHQGPDHDGDQHLDVDLGEQFLERRNGLSPWKDSPALDRRVIVVVRSSGLGGLDAGQGHVLGQGARIRAISSTQPRSRRPDVGQSDIDRSPPRCRRRSRRTA